MEKAQMKKTIETTTTYTLNRDEVETAITNLFKSKYPELENKTEDDLILFVFEREVLPHASVEAQIKLKEVKEE
jgi:hypothetical protein